jgi:hypothetical protein
MIPEEFLLHFEAAKKEALLEQTTINELAAGLDKTARELINKLYKDEIQHLSADAYRELERKIFHATSGLAVAISHVICL